MEVWKDIWDSLLSAVHAPVAWRGRDSSWWPARCRVEVGKRPDGLMVLGSAVVVGIENARQDPVVINIYQEIANYGVYSPWLALYAWWPILVFAISLPDS